MSIFLTSYLADTEGEYGKTIEIQSSVTEIATFQNHDVDILIETSEGQEDCSGFIQHIDSQRNQFTLVSPVTNITDKVRIVKVNPENKITVKSKGVHKFRRSEQ